uniref:T9SS type A sorting domain-containing protein n=1 Tax=Flavobacterium sp. TaxID=239 RepID=UPI0040497EF3
MKKLLLIMFLFVFSLTEAQVTQIWTDFDTFWTSSSTSINATQPNTAHTLLAFRWNGTNYSTGVDDAKLTANGVTYTDLKFRALPINEVPLTGGSSYFIGLGALVDGLASTVDNGITNPFVPLTTGIQKASYLTQGPQGLDLGSCLTNLPSGTPIRFNLSANGITLANVNDGLPDILVTQIASPSSTADTFRFVDSGGATVGNSVSANLNNNTNFPIVGNWNVDFYNNNSTQLTSGFVNTSREIRFLALDLTSFGINGTNYTDAVALIYTPSGSSDPAFLAFNEPSLGVASQLTITAQPLTSDCDGLMPTDFEIQLADGFGDAVAQAGIEITASMETGPGELLGTTTVTTDASGVATFSDLTFEVGGDHTIRFSNSSLDDAITANIVGELGCASNIWTGNGANDNWSNLANWQENFIPNANSDVEIPTSRPRYPVLQNDAGAQNLTMGLGATIDLNGHLFTISGDITKDASATTYIDASTTNSVLYMSGTAAQTIPSGFILDNAVANFTVENPAGVTTNDAMDITGVLLVREGNFETNDIVSLVCTFSPRQTGLIERLDGTISGLVEVQQCYPAKRAYRFITSSVTTTTNIRENWQENASSYTDNPNSGYGTHITGLGSSGPDTNDGNNGFDWQPSGTASLFGYNNTSQVWTTITNTDVNTLTAGTPYRMLIRGSRAVDLTSNASPSSNTILRSTGNVVKGPVSVSGLNSTVGAYNFVGNPFHAVVNMQSVINNATNITQFMYVWDPTLGTQGAYVTVNTSNNTNNNASSQANRNLQPFQAVFLETSNLGIAPVVTFNESYKLTTSTQTSVFRVNNEIENQEDVITNPFINVMLHKNVENGDNLPLDGTRIDFYLDGNNEVNIFDAKKSNNPDENIAVKNNNVRLSMEARAYPESNEQIQLYIGNYKSSEYVMTLHTENFEGTNAYLLDNYLNTTTQLVANEDTTYSFSVNAAESASTNEDRFKILFVNIPLSNEIVENVNQFSLYPNPASNQFYINTNGSFESANVTIFNTIGQSVYNKNLSFDNNNQIRVDNFNLQDGLYIVKVKTNSGEVFETKLLVK